jgi:hypothetical protein
MELLKILSPVSLPRGGFLLPDVFGSALKCRSCQTPQLGCRSIERHIDAACQESCRTDPAAISHFFEQRAKGDGDMADFERRWQTLRFSCRGIRTTRSISRYDDNCGDKEYRNQRKSAIQGSRAGLWTGRTERGHETNPLYSFTSAACLFGKDQPRTIHSGNDANQSTS